MREILFRGKRTDNRQWIYGDLYHRSICGVVSPTIHNLEYTGGSVDPATIGQFTGMVDKNGKKIFEGDIIESCSLSGDIARHRIGFDESMGCYIATLLIGQQAGYFFQLKQDWISKCDKVVAGNVYDSPELLKGGEK